MAIVINTNVESMIIQRSLGFATKNVNQAMIRMSTGLRLNSAVDGATDMVISKALELQERGNNVAINNAQNGVNLLGTAEGSLNKMQEHLLAIHDLTLQAMNGGLSPTEVKALEDEAKSRALEVDRLSNSTLFNEFKIFDSTKTTSNSTLTLQVGANSTSGINTIRVSGVFYNAQMSTLTTNGSTAGVSAANVTFTLGYNIKSRENLETLLNQVKTGIKSISSRLGEIGASSIRLNAAVDNLTVQNENLAAANARIKDADIAKESANYAKYSILKQVSAALLVQANQSPNIALTLI